MNTFVSLLVFGLRFVPVVNRLPFVRDYGSFAAAVKVIDKALLAIEHAAENAHREVSQLQAMIDSATAAQAAAKEEADRAKRVAGRFNDLLS